MRDVLVENDIKHYTLEEILENIDSINFEGISLATSYIYVNRQGEKMNLLYTNDENPISVGSTIMNLSNMLLINRDYYLKNKEYVDNLLKQIIAKRKKAYLELNGIELVNNEKIIDAIGSNPSIEEISLRDTESEYKLSVDMFHKMKETGHIKSVITRGVVDELKENFDPIIYCNSGSLYHYYSYKDLVKATSISASADMNDMNKMFYLKYLNPNAIIKIDLIDSFQLELFLENCNKFNINNKIVIDVDDKNKFNRILFNNLDLFLKHDIEIKLGTKKYPIKTYIEFEKRLLKMIEPAMNLSPLERYLFAYNIVKQYKPYKENDEDRFKARNVYELLDNEYMVCVGYSSLLIDLLSKLGITCNSYSVTVNTGYDKNQNIDMVATDKTSNNNGHARVEIKIDDDKYNVHGIYIADPTWDNFMKNDSYAHALMTRKEHDNLNRENILSIYSSSYLFDAESINDFYARVNHRLDYLYDKEKESNNRIINNCYKESLEKLNKKNNKQFTYDKIMDFILNIMHDKYHMNKGNQYYNYLSKEMLIKKIFTEVVNDYRFDSMVCDEDLTQVVIKSCEYCYKNAMKGPEKQEYRLISELLEYLEKFNKSLYEQIINKYPSVNSSNKTLSNDDISDIITTIGNYIISVNNNYVSGDTIVTAAIELYKKSSLSAEEIKEKIAKTVEFNKKYSDSSFPRRMRINPDGTEEVFMNSENKFDIKTR